MSSTPSDLDTHPEQTTRHENAPKGERQHEHKHEQQTVYVATSDSPLISHPRSQSGPESGGSGFSGSQPRDTRRDGGVLGAALCLWRLGL